MKLIAFAACAFLTAGAAVAAEEAASTETAPAAEESAAPAEEAGETPTTTAASDDKVVCKHVASTGSRFGRKVCATKREWEQMRKDSQESVGDIQRRNTGPGVSN